MVTLTLMFLGRSQNNFAQSSCNTALSYSGPNVGVEDTIQVLDSLCWIEFIADSSAVSITVDSIDGLNFAKVQKMYLYSGSCQNQILLDSNIGFSENTNVFTLYSNQLINGLNYYIKLELLPDTGSYLCLKISGLRIRTYSWN